MCPDLFKVYSETILRIITDTTGVLISGKNISNLIYANGTVVIAESVEKLHKVW